MSFLVAQIGKPHGLRGEVTVRLHTDDPQGRFAPGSVLRADGPGAPPQLTVRSARVHRETWLLAFDEAPDRSAAESLRGVRLSAEAEVSDDDGWYEDELVGLRVLDPAGAEIGEVSGLAIGAAQDRLVIRLADGAGAEVPLVAALVPVIDLDRGIVVVDAPPGLLELNRED
ncbi:MAG: ribosome maturation factor RimM [Tetrasphaera sp.]